MGVASAIDSLVGHKIGPVASPLFAGQRGIDPGMQHVHATGITGLHMLPISSRTWLRPAQSNTAQYIVQRPKCTVRCHTGNVAPAGCTRRSALSALAALFMQPALRARADTIPEQVPSLQRSLMDSPESCATRGLCFSL